MNWSDHKAIYLQIVDVMMDEILGGEVQAGQRALSVREKAAQIQVNPNTVVRSYGILEEAGVIQNKRGQGYFYAADTVEQARAYRKEAFSNEMLPVVFRTMELLQIEPAEFLAAYEDYKNSKQ
jgi:GntR family transcriptional regulator